MTSVDNQIEPADDNVMRMRIERLEQRQTGVEQRLTGVEQRLTGVEQRLTAVERDVAVIRSNYATREDLHRELTGQTWRLVTFVCGFGTVLVSATYFIATRAA